MSLVGPEVSNLIHYVPEDGLKVVRPRHVLMLRDYINGMSRSVIAMKYGVTPQTVTNLVNDPAVRETVQHSVQAGLNDMDTLLPLAVNAVRETLMDGSRKEKLTAADKVFKVKGLYTAQDEKRETAEDVMQRLLAAIQINGPTVVNINNGS